MKRFPRLLVVIIAVGALACLLISIGRRQGSTKEGKATNSSPRTAMSSKVSKNVIRRSVESPTASDRTQEELRLPDSVRPIQDTHHNYLERLAAVHALKRQLDQREIDSLFALLLKGTDEDSRQSGQVLKNELMDVLCGFQPPINGLDVVLANILQDENQHVVIRDYALQHMVPLYESWALYEQNANARPVREGLQSAMVLALRETQSSIAGTALLGMMRLSSTYAEFDRQLLSAEAVRLMTGDNACELVQVTALQVCADMGAQAALPTIVEMASKSGTQIPLRISAVGALGRIGTPQHVPLIESLIAEGNQRLRPALLAALHSLKTRFNAN